MWWSNNMWLRSLLRTWVGRPHGTSKTRKQNRAGKGFSAGLRFLYKWGHQAGSVYFDFRRGEII